MVGVSPRPDPIAEPGASACRAAGWRSLRPGRLSALGVSFLPAGAQVRIAADSAILAQVSQYRITRWRIMPY